MEKKKKAPSKAMKASKTLFFPLLVSSSRFFPFLLLSHKFYRPDRRRRELLIELSIFTEILPPRAACKREGREINALGPMR
jgi:hypothetical protein